MDPKQSLEDKPLSIRALARRTGWSRAFIAKGLAKGFIGHIELGSRKFVPASEARRLMGEKSE
jgi:hypothetical protein